jgi:hypothetical protein
VGVVQGEFLRDCATEGDAEDVDAGEAKRVEEVGDMASQSGHATREDPRWGFAGAGGVEGDGLDAVPVEGSLDRVPHLDVAAQSHDQQKWRSLTADADPYEVSIHPRVRAESAVRHRHVGHRRWT